MPHSIRLHAHFALFSAVAAALAAPCHATDIRWTNGSGGTFNTNTNWLGSVVPGTADIADFGVAVSGTGPTYTVTTTTGPLTQALAVHRDNVTLALSGFTYNVTGIGLSGNSLVVGAASGETGTLSLSNGTLNTSDSSSSFVSSIGQVSGATGTINLNSNAVWTDNAEERIGDAGTGTLAISGTHNVNGPLEIGFTTGAVGTIGLLSGANLHASSGLFVGGSNAASGGAGTLTINSGANATVTGTLKIWNSTSVVNLLGGNLTVQTLDTGFTPSRFNWTTGTLTLTSDLFIDSSGPLGTTLSLVAGKTLVCNGQEVGFNSNGTVNQTGGINSSTLWIDLGSGSGNGTYSLSGGSVSAPGTGASDSRWGSTGAGTFNQTGGSASFGDISMGVNGTLTLNDPSDAATFSANTINATTSGATHANISIVSGSMTINSLVMSNTNALTLSGGNLSVGTFTITDPTRISWTGGNLTVTGVPGLTFGASNPLATPVINGGMSLSVVNGITLNAGALLTLNGGTINTPTITNSDPTRFVWNAGLLNITSPTVPFLISATGPIGASISLTPARILDATNLNNSGIISFSNGTLINSVGTNNGTLTGFGNITIFNSFTNNAQITQTGGSLILNISGFFNNQGEIDLSTSGQFQIIGGPSAFSNIGTINLNASSIAGNATLTNFGGNIVGRGTILTPFNNTSGALIVPAGLTNIVPSFPNGGLILLTDPAANLAGGAIINTGGTIQGLGLVSAATINNGSIEAINGTLTFSGTTSNSLSGTIAAGPNAKLLVTQGLATNAGIISLTGGTFDNNGHALDNTGEISGFGIFRSLSLTNDGNITFTGGLSTINGNVINNASHTLNIKFNPAIFTGIVTNNLGAIIKTTSTTVTFAGTFNNAGTFTSDPATNIFSTLDNSGLVTGGPGDVFTINATFTNTGTFTNGGTLNANGNVINSASFSQTGPQSWSSTATFTNTAGLATFASNAKLANLTITAGTIDLTTSKFIIEPTNKSTTLAALQSNIANHSLISSTLPANFGLALLDNALTQFTTFAGLPVDNNSLLLAPELLGDTNIDGHVDLTDLSTILNNFGTATSSWTSGNFDNAPTIDLTDLSDVLNNFGLTNPNPNASSVTTSAGGSEAVPEPASLALLALSAPFLLRKCRSTRSK